MENTLKLDASHYKLLYLTLYGSEPSKESLGSDENEKNKKPFWESISYRDFIREWLDECIKLATRHPLIREVLNQYLQLIKELTYQTLEESMKEEVVQLLMDGQNLKYAQEMALHIDEAKHRIMKERIVPKIRELEGKLKLECHVPDSLCERYTEFSFTKDAWIENNFYVGFMFEKNNYAGFHYYINQYGDKEIRSSLIDGFKKIGEHSWTNDAGVEFPLWTLKGLEWDDYMPVEWFIEPDQFMKRIEDAHA